MAGGRPSKYDPAYCALIVEEMAQGKSATAVAADIGVCRDTISEWVSVHPEFSVALKRGKAKAAAWWEDRLRTIVGGQAGNVTAAIFGLKNMAAEDWKDKHDVEHSGNLTVEIVRFDTSKAK
jgi:hypothetical protein